MDLPRFDFSRGDPNFSTEDPNFHFGTIFYVGWFGQPYLGWEWLSSVRGMPLGTPNFRYLLILSDFCQFGVLRAQKLIKMCTKMLVFSVANSQNTHHGLKRVFFWDK